MPKLYVVDITNPHSLGSRGRVKKVVKILSVCGHRQVVPLGCQPVIEIDQPSLGLLKQLACQGVSGNKDVVVGRFKWFFPVDRKN